MHSRRHARGWCEMWQLHWTAWHSRARSRPVLSAPSLATARLRQAAGLAALAAVVGLAFGLDLGRAYLWDPGEGRYAETVREMLLTHNWIVPTLDFAHYYDKPP